MDSPELSHREIRRRLRAVWAATEHFKLHLPADNPHNQILRIADIARYVREPYRMLLDTRLEEPPARCTRDCKTVNDCPHRCRGYNQLQQERLSRFFHGWDNGTLVKARLGDHWGIIQRHATLAQMAAPAGTARPDLLGRIDLTYSGPRLTWR